MNVAYDGHDLVCCNRAVQSRLRWTTVICELFVYIDSEFAEGWTNTDGEVGQYFDGLWPVSFHCCLVWLLKAITACIIDLQQCSAVDAASVIGCLVLYCKLQFSPWFCKEMSRVLSGFCMKVIEIFVSLLWLHREMFGFNKKYF